MAEILSLPDHVLEMIAAKTATSLSEYETSWGAAAMTCKRLHNVQLPAEYVAVHDYQSLVWLLPRVKDVKGLFLHTCFDTLKTCASKRSPRQNVNLLLAATSSLSQLHTLVLTGNLRPVIPWTMELLVGATSLHTLQYDMITVPCPPILRRLPLKHLILTVRSPDELQNALDDISYCHTLESLSLEACVLWKQKPVPELSSVDLSNALQLQHVKLTDLAPSVSGELLLPPGCFLSLAGGLSRSRRMHELWSERWVARQDTVKVLSMSYKGPGPELSNPQELLTYRPGVPGPWPCPWPKGVETFPALQMVRLDYISMLEPLELAVFAHIPCLSLRCKWKLNVTVKEGSWQLLELEGRSGFKLSIPDMHSFLRSVRGFALTLPSAYTDSVKRLVEACRALHVALHVEQHQADDLSPSPWIDGKTCAQLTILSNDKRFVGGLNLDSAVLMGVWPANPVPCQQSAKWALIGRPKQEPAPAPGSPEPYMDSPWMVH